MTACLKSHQGSLLRAGFQGLQGVSHWACWVRPDWPWEQTDPAFLNETGVYLTSHCWERYTHLVKLGCMAQGLSTQTSFLGAVVQRLPDFPAEKTSLLGNDPGRLREPFPTPSGSLVVPDFLQQSVHSTQTPFCCPPVSRETTVTDQFLSIQELFFP